MKMENQMKEFMPVYNRFDDDDDEEERYVSTLKRMVVVFLILRINLLFVLIGILN